MDRQKRIICRLCFKIEDDLDNFKAMEKHILDKVLQKTNLAAIQYPVMCTKCADTLIKCSDFKSKCINTRDSIAPFINKDTVKLDLTNVYISKNKNGTAILEVQDVCGLCMSPLKTSICIERDVALRKMIEQCVPELDMNIIKKPVICIPCHSSLENCFHFLQSCLIVEEKIKQYCKSQDIDSKDGIELSNLLQFRATHITRNVGGASANLIKVENQFCEGIENADETRIADGGAIFKFEQMSCDDHENYEKEFELKSESFMDTDELTFNNGIIKTEEPFCGENGLKEENFVKMENPTFFLNEEVVIKTDDSYFNRFEDDILPEPKVSKDDLKIHLLMHKDPQKVMYKSDSCLFQTKHKKILDRHLLKHMDSPEATIYKCDSCSYEAKSKEYLKNHLLKHKDASEVTMYKCDFCSFQTKHNKSLDRHLLKHMDSPERTMYKCDSCSYQAEHKGNIKRHLLKHKDPSEVTMYNCDSCCYQTKSKESLKRHLLKHKDPSEVTMYKCDSCFYQTKDKRGLKSHYLLKHKDPSEVTMYKCDSCLYQAKSKQYLKRHLLMHKHPSEVTIYKCDSCSYQTRDKSGFKKHYLLKHTDPSEATMYNCDFCVYQTKSKGNFKRHLLKHQGPTDVPMYNCDSCLYQTRIKGNIKIHLQKHKDPST